MTYKTRKDVAPKEQEQEQSEQVVIPHNLTVGQLAELLEESAIEVIKELMRNGVMANINQVIDYETAAAVARDFGLTPKEEPRARGQVLAGYRHVAHEEAGAKPRPPVVTIMGHVDHGKTSLLDAIRESNITATEAGEITQHIGAYQVEVGGQKITFLDTPGHEAFTAMRARGAQVTDIAIIVVAADDGVMPQTVEAINHARAAGIPLVVALNKIDKPNANVDRVKQQLADNGVIIEEWGGDVVCVPISAKRKEGITDLLENLLIVAEMQELRADPNRKAIGTVVEAAVDSSRGPVATVLVQTGTLKVGDTFVVGDTWGRVKAMQDDRGKRVRKAEPATPAEILGINGVPQAGDVLRVVASEKEARVLVEQQQSEKEHALVGSRALKLDDVYSQIKAGQVKDLNLILKVDVQGSIEPIRASLERLAMEEVQVRIIHAGTGSITESDVMLAVASKGIIVGFSTRPEPGASRLADAEGVDIRTYDVIYSLVEDVEKALTGLLEPVYVDVVDGHGEVRALFSTRQGKIAGTYITDGKAVRGGQVRVIRGGEVIHLGTVTNLKHFKENVREMAAGFECGVLVEGISDFQLGDVLEFYHREQRSRAGTAARR